MVWRKLQLRESRMSAQTTRRSRTIRTRSIGKVSRTRASSFLKVGRHHFWDEYFFGNTTIGLRRIPVVFRTFPGVRHCNIFRRLPPFLTFDASKPSSLNKRNQPSKFKTTHTHTPKIPKIPKIPKTATITKTMTPRDSVLRQRASTTTFSTSKKRTKSVKKEAEKLQPKRALDPYPINNHILRFSPPLSLTKQAAIQAFGMGLENKVILRFSSVFWAPSQYLHSVPHFRYIILNLNHFGKGPILVVHVPPPFSFEMEQLDDREVVADVMKVLRLMHEEVPDPVQTHGLDSTHT